MQAMRKAELANCDKRMEFRGTVPVTSVTFTLRLNPARQESTLNP